MELMIVIVIIGILSAVGMVMFGGQSEKAKIAVTKANHKQVVKYITVELMNAENAMLSIYNANGQEVSKVWSGMLSEGTHSFTWNASDVVSGVYMVRAEYNGQVSTQKLMLLK